MAKRNLRTANNKIDNNQGGILQSLGRAFSSPNLYETDPLQNQRAPIGKDPLSDSIVEIDNLIGNPKRPEPIKTNTIVNETTASNNSFSPEEIDEMLKKSTTTITGIEDVQNVPDNELFDNNTVYVNEAKNKKYFKRDGEWIDISGGAEMQSPVEENNASTNTNELDNDIFPSENTNTKDRNLELYEEMEDIAKRQRGLDTIRSIEYLSNAIAAVNQPLSEGFEAPTYSFTPTLSTRDRDLAELNRQVSSNTAKTTNMLQEYGMADHVVGAMSDAINKMQAGKYEIGSRELQRLANDVQRMDEVSSEQSIADSTIHNKNIEKAMHENQALGAEYTGNMENFFRTMTDINRQKAESAVVKNLATGPQPAQDLSGYFKSKFGFAKETNKKQTNNNFDTNS